MKSELDTTDPRKNFWPWIVRTQHGDGDIDINLIVNVFFLGRGVFEFEQSCFGSMNR
jgi:hypothetical protein